MRRWLDSGRNAQRGGTQQENRLFKTFALSPGLNQRPKSPADNKSTQIQLYQVFPLLGADSITVKTRKEAEYISVIISLFEGKRLWVSY